MNIKSFFNLKYLRWFFGLFFALFSLVYIKESVITSVSFFLLTLFTLPPFSNIPSSIIKKPINKPAKLIIGFLLLLIAVKFTPPTNNPNTSSVQGSFSIITPTPTSTPILPTPSPLATPTTNLNLIKVTRIVDGDTIMVEINGKAESVRLIGIDTPETIDPRKPIQCFGKEASAKAKELIENKNVILDSDSTQGDRDKYNRLLRYVHLEDGTFVNQKLIEDGFAFEYTYNIPYKYQAEFKEAQKQAETNRKGLWADNACPSSAPVPTVRPTSKPLPTKASTVQPTATQVQVETNVVPLPNNSDSSWSCNCSKTCPQMSSCAEAQYQLNSCGCQARDADKDGIACDSDCQ